MIKFKDNNFKTALVALIISTVIFIYQIGTSAGSYTSSGINSVHLGINQNYININGNNQVLDPKNKSFPIINEEHIMIPIIPFLERICSDFSYDNNILRINNLGSNDNIIIDTEKNTITSNNNTTSSEQVFILKNNVLYFSTGFLEKYLGFLVNYEPQSKIININFIYSPK
jgi:hypothetical protein